MLSTWLIGSGCVIAAASSLSAEELAPADAMRVEVSQGLLSVEVGEVPRSSVLRVIGGQTGLLVNISGNLGTTDPQVFRRLPLAEGIQRLLGDSGIGVVLLYAPDDAGRQHLAEIRAYEMVRSAVSVPPQLPAEFWKWALKARQG